MSKSTSWKLLEISRIFPMRRMRRKSVWSSATPAVSGAAPCYPLQRAVEFSYAAVSIATNMAFSSPIPTTRLVSSNGRGKCTAETSPSHDGRCSLDTPSRAPGLGPTASIEHSRTISGLDVPNIWRQSTPIIAELQVSSPPTEHAACLGMLRGNTLK